MNIAVCDDDKIILKMIQHMIKNAKLSNTEDFAVTTFYTGEDLLSAIKGSKYIPARHFDIIFLDIQMAGINGIETAKAIRADDEETVLIFITAIKQYVFEAFDVSAFHYLLKPINQQKFTSVFLQAVREVQRHQNTSNEILVVKSGKNSITLQQSHIYYIESKGKKLEIHTDKRVIEIYAALRSLEQELSADFYRCHRGYLVNMAYIAAYNKDSITVANGDKIYLTREKYNTFVKTYMRYLRNGVHGSV